MTGPASLGTAEVSECATPSTFICDGGLLGCPLLLPSQQKTEEESADFFLVAEIRESLCNLIAEDHALGMRKELNGREALQLFGERQLQRCCAQWIL